MCPKAVWKPVVTVTEHYPLADGLSLESTAFKAGKHLISRVSKRSDNQLNANPRPTAIAGPVNLTPNPPPPSKAGQNMSSDSMTPRCRSSLPHQFPRQLETPRHAILSTWQTFAVEICYFPCYSCSEARDHPKRLTFPPHFPSPRSVPVYIQASERPDTWQEIWGWGRDFDSSVGVPRTPYYSACYYQAAAPFITTWLAQSAGVTAILQAASCLEVRRACVGASFPRWGHGCLCSPNTGHQSERHAGLQTLGKKNMQARSGTPRLLSTYLLMRSSAVMHVLRYATAHCQPASNLVSQSG